MSDMAEQLSRIMCRYVAAKLIAGMNVPPWLPAGDNFGPDPDILKQQTRDARKANNEKKPPSFDEASEGQNLHRAFQK